MTATFNTSVLSSPTASGCQTGKKGYRSRELNNYKVEVVDFDGLTEDYEVEAASHAEAAEKAEELAYGMQVNYMNIYKIL